MNKTGIGWTDFTANPLRYRTPAGRDVWACVKVSAGCTHCYAAELARRYVRGAAFNAAETERLEAYLDVAELHQLATSKLPAGKRVFLADMTDIFGHWVPRALQVQLFDVLAARPDVTWQVLTKRPEQLYLFTEYWLSRLPYRAAVPGHIWLGVSVEDQDAAEARVPILLHVRAQTRFLSVEPLLEPVDLKDYLFAGKSVVHDEVGWDGDIVTIESLLDWVIVGGESGPGYRPCKPDWITDVAAQCLAARVPVFVKQDAHARPGQQGRLDPDTWALKQFPAGVR